MAAERQAATGNAAQIEFWNSAATRAWADQYARMDRAVAGLTKELLNLAAPQPGERVLDIGCGPGTTVLELAKHVGRRSCAWRRCLQAIGRIPFTRPRRFCTRAALVRGAEMAGCRNRTSGCVARRGPRLPRRHCATTF
jgi:SAM-dependent methyltransferase